MNFADLHPRTFQGLEGTEVSLFQRVLKGMEGFGVEIGCLDGFSTAIILDSSKLILVSIDPFIPDSMEKSLIGSKERFKHNVASFGHRSNLIEDYSYNVAKLDKAFDTGDDRDNEIDFLFIDGDHTKAAVEKDWDDWVPRIKVGGILAMHDSRMYRPRGANFHEGSSKVAMERVYTQPSQWEVIGEAFSLTIAKKL
jgi:hypothetical protein